SRKHHIGSLTALNGFGPRLLNPAEQTVDRRSPSACFRERRDGRNQGCERDNNDAHHDQKFDQREGSFWRRPFHAFSPIVLRATPSEQGRREIMAGKTGYGGEGCTGGGLFFSRLQGRLRKFGATVTKLGNNDCSCVDRPRL